MNNWFQPDSELPPACRRVARRTKHKCIFDSLGAAGIILDREGHIVTANPLAQDLLLLGLRELEGRKVDEVLVPFDVIKRCVKVDSGEEFSGQARINLPDGRDIMIGYSVSKFSEDIPEGDKRRYAVLFQDITLGEVIREERNRLLQLATVGDILPSLLHELKNPLASISTVIEILLEESKDSEIHQDLEAVYHEIYRMKLTLDGVGAVGRSLKSHSENPIHDTIENVFRVLEAQAKRKKLHTSTTTSGLRPLKLDGSVLGSIIYNIGMNAIHACKHGDQISLTAEFDNDSLDITISDTGCGMTPEVRERCTEIFFTTKAKGSGIGLALCNRALTEIGGELSIESVVEKGTTISMRIPLKE